MDERLSIESLTGLLAFARAASLGSYTAAARSLGVSPSAVSKSVQRLEEQLGVSLFTRTTRSLSLTAVGRELQGRALRLLREAEEIEQTVLATRAAPGGTLRVTAPLPIARQLLAPALPGLRERFPRLSIDLTATDRFVDLVDERIDVAIRVGELDDSRLTSRRLAPHWVCAFASPAYLKRRGTPSHPDDLVNHDCVNFRFQSSGQALRWPFRVDGREIEVTPNAWAVADASEAVSEILIAGGGIGIAPTYLSARHVARGDLVPVLVDYAVERSVITALWPANRRNNPNVKVFLSLLKELFPSSAPWDAFLRKPRPRSAKAPHH